MKRSRVVALLWLAAGAAFLIVGVLADRRQSACFAVATSFFAISAITSRRARTGGLSATAMSAPRHPRTEGVSKTVA